MIWRFLEWKSKTLVQHLANRTNYEMQIPYDGCLGTSPLNQRKLTIGNPKSSRLSETLVWIWLSITFIFKFKKEVSMSEVFALNIKAILQVLIYKALYDKSYLGSKTTMTSGEWTCLISFATAPLTCSERGGSEKFKMKIYVSSGIRTHTRQSTTV